MAAKVPVQTRVLIIEKAKELLRKFGNDKLTVVDIARSLGMSHANVYRYFRNKSDILDAIIDEWLAKIEAFVEEIAARPGPAARRIEAVVLELHRKRKQKLRDDAEVFETYRRVIELRPEAAARRREKILRVFVRLVEEGMSSGEFRQVDCEEVAVALKDATALFLHPLVIPTTLNEDTDERARNVVRFMLAGVLASPPKATADVPPGNTGRSRLPSRGRKGRTPPVSA